MLNYLKKLFLIPAYYKCETSFNKEAAHTYIHNLSEFVSAANKCVQLSQSHKYENEEGSCIKFSAFTTVHKKILDNLLTRPEVT